MSDVIQVWEVSSLLRNDTGLIFEWEFFYHTLGLDVGSKLDLTKAYNQNPNSFSLLNAILERWVGMTGRNATIIALANVLKATKHLASEEELMKKFRNGRATLSLQGGQSNRGNRIFYQPNPNRAEEMRHNNQDLQQRTKPSGVSILELMPNAQEGEGRVVIVISYLLKLLSDIGDKPVAIISINGKQRSGKSFLANQFIKYLKASRQQNNWLDAEMERSFIWSDDNRRVTSGIQIFHEPLEVDYNGRKYAVIIMDTQGLHDSQTGTAENAVIFGLSVLLSSVFIYNEKHAADDSLQYLRSFLEFAKFATGGNENGNAGGPQHMKFQKLILLLRDWQSESRFNFGYYDQNTCPPNERRNLKREMFDIQDGMHHEAVDTRRGIEKCFESTAVYAMCGPGNRRPDKPQYKLSSSWDSEFKDGIVDFVGRIFSPQNIANSTKKVFGQEFSGEGLKTYVSKWAELIQAADGKVQSKPIFEATADLYFNGKSAELLLIYKNRMGSETAKYPAGMTPATLEQFHLNLLNELNQAFSSGGAFGGPEMLNMHKTKFLQAINLAKTDFVTINTGKIQAEEERQRAIAAWNETVRQAQQRLCGAQNDLRNAQERLRHAQGNQATYTQQVTTKHRNRFLGITVSPSYSTQTVFNSAAFQAAINTASNDVTTMTAKVTEAEQNLAKVNNDKPKCCL